MVLYSDRTGGLIKRERESNLSTGKHPEKAMRAHSQKVAISKPAIESSPECNCAGTWILDL